MSEDLIYLDTYLLQQDMRIRLPKSVLTNLNVERGLSHFQIYYDKINDSLVLKPERKQQEDK
jgi:antitoxin component of MazEF toxin-antitoxin module